MEKMSLGVQTNKAKAFSHGLCSSLNLNKEKQKGLQVQRAINALMKCGDLF